MAKKFSLLVCLLPLIIWISFTLGMIFALVSENPERTCPSGYECTKIPEPTCYFIDSTDEIQFNREVDYSLRMRDDGLRVVVEGGTEWHNFISVTYKNGTQIPKCSEAIK